MKRRHCARKAHLRKEYHGLQSLSCIRLPIIRCGSRTREQGGQVRSCSTVRPVLWTKGGVSESSRRRSWYLWRRRFEMVHCHARGSYEALPYEYHCSAVEALTLLATLGLQYGRSASGLSLVRLGISKGLVTDSACLNLPNLS